MRKTRQVENIKVGEHLSRKDKYETLIPQIKALVEGEEDAIANIANIVAALKEVFGFLWTGVYFVKSKAGREELVLGPFQGPVACVRIAKGKGVCGTAWERNAVVVVDDVDKFPGHIACSPLSRSEIVVPIAAGANVLAVIDIDSKETGDFGETDVRYLSQVAAIISPMLC